MNPLQQACLAYATHRNTAVALYAAPLDALRYLFFIRAWHYSAHRGQT